MSFLGHVYYLWNTFYFSSPARAASKVSLRIGGAEMSRTVRDRVASFDQFRGQMEVFIK